MSGQPNLNTSDADKYRNQYMANLNLQAKNDDINLQANKIFKKTGQTPSQPTDTRNTTEKLADIERLKLDLRASLSAIADGQQAQAIVNELGQDPRKLQFVAEHITDIIDLTKKKWKYGVLSAEFIPFIDRYMLSEAITQGLSIGMQETTGQQMLLTTRQIIDQMGTKDNLLELNEMLQRSSKLMENRLLQTLKRDLSALEDVLLDESTLRAVDDIKNAETKLMIRQEISNALNDLPTKRDLVELSRKLEIALAHNDAKAVDAVGAEIHQILVMEPATVQELQAVATQLKGDAGGGERQPASIADAWINLFSPDRPNQSIKVGHKAYWDFLHQLQDENIVVYPGRFTVSGGKPVKPSLKDCKEFLERPDIKTFLDTKFGVSSAVKRAARNKTKIEILWDIYSRGDALKIADLKSIINLFFDRNPSKSWPGGKKAYATASAEELTEYIDENAQDIEDTIESVYGDGGGKAPTTGMTMGKSAPSLGAVEASQGAIPSGKGIRGRGIAVDYTKGIQNTNKAKYVPFGKFIINPKRLENDIIAIRRPKGSVPIPTQRTSQKLGGVIRKIVGGGNPSFEDLNALNEDEKHYLHKLMKTTNLIDRISVPAPSKEQDDKDINRFEVLRGEIMSGNDSHQLIKEFKLLILKLVNKELLPKSQSREILYDLMALGF